MQPSSQCSEPFGFPWRERVGQILDLLQESMIACFLFASQAQQLVQLRGTVGAAVEVDVKAVLHAEVLTRDPGRRHG